MWSKHTCLLNASVSLMHWKRGSDNKFSWPSEVSMRFKTAVIAQFSNGAKKLLCKESCSVRDFPTSDSVIFWVLIDDIWKGNGMVPPSMVLGQSMFDLIRLICINVNVYCGSTLKLLLLTDQPFHKKFESFG